MSVWVYKLEENDIKSELIEPQFLDNYLKSGYTVDRSELINPPKDKRIKETKKYKK